MHLRIPQDRVGVCPKTDGDLLGRRQPRSELEKIRVRSGTEAGGAAQAVRVPAQQGEAPSSNPHATHTHTKLY
jgi:hypothetical protein